MPKEKNLTLSDLKKMNSKLNNKKRIHLDDNYFLDIDQNFRPTKIQLILERILEVNKYITDNNIEKFDIISYSFLLAIKQFTSLQIEDELSIELKALELLIDLEYFSKIIEGFGEDNLRLLFDKLNEAIKNVNVMQNKLYEEIMKLQNEKIDKQKELE